MNIFPLHFTIIAILSSISLSLSVILTSLSPSFRRYGYGFITPLLLSFLAYFIPPLSDNLDILWMILLLSLPVVWLIMSVFVFSVKAEIQMLYLTIMITAFFISFIILKTSMIIDALNSKIILTILFTFNIMALYPFKGDENKSILQSLSFITIANLFLIMNKIMINKLPIPNHLIELLSYFLTIIGYGLAIKAIATNYHININTLHNTYQKLTDDFDDEVRKEVKKQTRRVEWAKEQLKQKSEIDNLTGALRKKPLIDLITSYIDSSDMQKFSILMFDIDNFKSLNDNHGHITGDKCLKDLVSIARSSIDFNDAIGRYGGDEFFIVLPNQPAGSALKIADRIRQNVMKKTDPPFTISLGIASYPWDGKSHKKLIEVADNGLYTSKKKGRNAASYTGELKIY